MRRAARTDRNQAEIVEALRKLGASVEVLSGRGDGVPDLLVGHEGRNLLVEVKDGLAKPSARTLTSRQVEWHRQWTGQAAIVASVEEAIALVFGRD